jgi:glycosyltransferase involved in cell wall biosynthesis
MKVLFHNNTINYRGTTVASTDYARYNQEILGNESVIAYCKTNGIERDMGNEQAVIDELSKEFEVVGYRAGDLEKKIDNLHIDTAYFINSGRKEELPTNCNTAVHAVFQFNEPHGDRYAYVSEWLSQTMSKGEIPFVPHIVQLPNDTGNYRGAFNIRADQKVIGRIGGYYTFDIPFVKECIKRIVTSTDEFVFLFAGTEPFINHPNVHFINEFHNPLKKARFINTCDAMLHARQRGESFGLSIAEFLSMNKPVMAWNDGHDRNHIEMLAGSGLLYKDEYELDVMIRNISAWGQELWSKRVEQFKPEVVMSKFKDVFL